MPKRKTPPQGAKKAMEGVKRQKTQKGKVIKELTPKGYSPESKSVDTSGAITMTNAASGNINLLNGLILGSDRFNRIGRRVRMTGIHLHILVSEAAIANRPPDSYIIGVVYDKEPTTTLPTLADLFENVSAGGVATSNALAHNNLNNSTRFQWLHKHRIFQNPTGAGGGLVGGMLETPVHKMYHEVHIKCDLGMQFNGGNAGTLADIEKGALFIIGYSLNSTGGGGGAATLQYSSRVRFSD